LNSQDLPVTTVAVAPDGASVPTPIDWRPWNEALAMINLVAGNQIVEAAHAIDDEIWPVHQQIKRGWVPDGGWPRQRDLIEVRRQDFVNIARRRLAPRGVPLRRMGGRPAADDPFWQFRRSYFLTGNNASGITAKPDEPSSAGPSSGSQGQ
jgi:hypothetical protein